jgi:hypothetical protein
MITKHIKNIELDSIDINEVEIICINITHIENSIDNDLTNELLKILWISMYVESQDLINVLNIVNIN